MSHPRRFAQLFPLRFAQVVEGCHDDVKGGIRDCTVWKPTEWNQAISYEIGEKFGNISGSMIVFGNTSFMWVNYSLSEMLGDISVGLSRISLLNWS